MDDPRVTVLLTVYDGERYLARTVESVLAQTFEAFEFVVIDDGSTDRTPEILASFDDPRLRVKSQTNRGRAPALNRGLELARGKYISVIDDDDLAAPTRLEASVEFLDANPEIDLLGAGYERRYEADGNIVASETVIPPTTDAELRRVLPLRNPFAHSLVTYRRQAAERVGGYRHLRSCIDYDLWVRFATTGSRLASLDSVLGVIRKHGDRSFDFGRLDHLRYLRTAYAVQRVAARGLNLPVYYRAAPHARFAWGLIPSPLKSVIRPLIP